MHGSVAIMSMTPEAGNFSANAKFHCSSPLLGPDNTPVEHRTFKGQCLALSSAGSNKRWTIAPEHDGHKDGCQQSSTRLSDVDLASRKAEVAATRRFQAASWLQQMVGPLGLSSEPTEEELRLVLRNGLVLCNLINRIQPGAVSKVVENPTPSSPPEGPALSAFQYFENVRNFLVAVEEMKLPSFEASDLEKGSLQTGSSAKVVDCILGLKSYHEWKQSGGQGFWKFGGALKSPCAPYSASRPGSGSPSMDALTNSTFKPNQHRKRWILPSPDCPKSLSEEFTSSFPYGGKAVQLNDGQKLQFIYDAQEGDGNAWPNSDLASVWMHHFIEKFPDVFHVKSKGLQEAALEIHGERNGNIPSSSFLTLLTTLLDNKQPEEVPLLVEFLLRKIIEEFESREEQIKRCQFEAEKELKSEDATHDLGDQQEQQAKISFLKLELEQVKSMDQEREFCLEVQRDEIQGLKNEVRNTRQELVKMQSEWEAEIKDIGVHFQGLARAAEQHKKVAAENRELYNEVQDLKGNIRVYCRVRPFLPGQNGTQTTVDFIGENGSMMIVNPMKQGKDQRRTFNFNKVFGPSSSQEDVFFDTQPLIRSVLDGYNVCIFAYGQTGSGKTHTMTGPNNASEKDWGVNFRALHDLFQISQSRKDLMNYEVCVQMIEIYNEQVRDLLCTDGANKRLEIRNSSQQNGINVPDASMVHVNSTLDVIELMNLGHKNRSVGATALNERSSRSHSVLTVHVQGTDLTSGVILRGCLHLVDLAGSERVDKSEAVGDRLKEAQHINKSLSALGDVISALAQKSTHIPYRNSKLTQLLQDSLGGQAKTLMFVHISPDEESYGETVSSLKFAERVASVELGSAHSNRESGEVRDLKEQIASMKEALAKKDAELERLQKDARTKGIESGPEKIRVRTGISPSRSRRVNMDLQVNRRQPLEEVRNAEVRQSHIFGITAQKHTENSDFCLEDGHFTLQPQLPDRHGVSSTSQEEINKRRATKPGWQGSSPESRSSNTEICYSTASLWNSTTKNKIQHENYGNEEAVLRNTQERLVNNQNISVSSDDIPNTSFSEQPSSMNPSFESGQLKAVDWTTESKFVDEPSHFSVGGLQSTCSEGVPKRRCNNKRNSQTKRSFQVLKEAELNQDYSTEDSMGRRGDAEEEKSDVSESELWHKKETDALPATEQMCRTNKVVTGPCGKLRQSTDRRSLNQMQHSAPQNARKDRKTPNGVVGQGQTRPRRYSLVGSTTFGVEGMSTKRSEGKHTLEAKLVAISPEGAVECYAKTTLPRQSYSAHVGISSKSSKRWL